MSFQSVVNQYPAPAVAGDFASANPRASVLAGEGAFLAGVGGVTVGRFAWTDTAATNSIAVSNGTSGVLPRGFVARDMQAMIVGLTNEATMNICQGLNVTLFNLGDFWAKTNTVATVGQKVYANYADGSISTGATGSPPVAASVTADTGAVVTGSISGTVLTVSAVASGHLSVGDVISGSGISVGTTITSLGSGTGGTGTYNVSISQTASSTTVTAVGTTMTVTAVGSGSLSAGEPISGTGVTAGTYIVAQLTGTAGGAGTYQLSTAQRFTSATVTALGGIETNWYVGSAGAVGELIKITTTIGG